MTITEAIKKVMINHGAPMTVNEAYHAIVVANHYEFHTDNPLQIVRSQISRHCEGLDFTSATPTKYFKLIGENRYWVLDQQVQQRSRNPRNKRQSEQIQTPINHIKTGSDLEELQSLYTRYIVDLKKKILSDLKCLSPAAFETFAKRLLDVYGVS